jgi:hypothetical protein
MSNILDVSELIGDKVWPPKLLSHFSSTGNQNSLPESI